MLSKTSAAVKEAYEKGYRVINEKVYSPYSGEEIVQLIGKKGYKYFSISMNDYGRYTIETHRLVAYQKFGDKIFEPGIQVRHLDGNYVNNSDDNISIGTQSDNRQDIPKEVRVRAARIAGTKYNADEIKELYEELGSYTKVMRATGIKSKGTISYIINKR